MTRIASTVSTYALACCAALVQSACMHNVDGNVVFHVDSGNLNVGSFIAEQLSGVESTLPAYALDIDASFVVVDLPLDSVYDPKVDRREFALMAAETSQIDVFIVDRIVVGASTVGLYVDDVMLDGRYIDFIVIEDDDCTLNNTHPTTLAHELGHMYGLIHAKGNDNLMTVGREDTRAHRLTKGQLRLLSMGVKRRMRNG